MIHIFFLVRGFQFFYTFSFSPGQGAASAALFFFLPFLNKKVINFVINFVIKFLIKKVINFLINFLINSVINLLINFLINFLMHNVNNKFSPDPGRKSCKIGKKWAKSLKNNTYKIEKGEFLFYAHDRGKGPGSRLARVTGSGYH